MRSARSPLRRTQSCMYDCTCAVKSSRESDDKFRDHDRSRYLPGIARHTLILFLYRRLQCLERTRSSTVCLLHLDHQPVLTAKCLIISQCQPVVWQHQRFLWKFSESFEQYRGACSSGSTHPLSTATEHSSSASVLGSAPSRSARAA